MEKILWTVDCSDLQKFVARARNIGATSVAIRTDNDVEAAIDAFAGTNIAVFGWRWPDARRARALAEADNVVDLLGKGMAGYHVDPEGAKGKSYDWDRDGLAELAEEFCQRITTGAPGKILGVTSHYKAATVFPNLPWASFLQYADVLLPQAYWRSDDGIIGSGQPGPNYRAAITAWQQIGGQADKIVPMAGEIARAKPAEIVAYATEARAQGRTEMHFYTDEPAVPEPVWEQIAAA